MPEAVRQLRTGLRAVILLTVVLGIAYPALVLGLGHAFEHERTGSPVTRQGVIDGSSLIAQPFPGPGWFQPRPSAVDYNALASGGSNLGPNSDQLVVTIDKRRREVARREGVPAEAVPTDAVTVSGSGLDPNISPAYAELQVNRVARERGLSPDRVRALVAAHTQGRVLGFLGQPRVNVVELNTALADQG